MKNEKNNKQIILDVALNLFSAHGYDAVGVQALCEKSELTKPTLYYYFGSKEGIFEELLKIDYQKLDNALEKSAAYCPNPHSYFEDVYPVLVNVVQTYFDFAVNNEKFYRMVLSATFLPPESKVNEMVRKYHIRQYEIIGGMFEKMSAYHGNTKGNEQRLAWTFIGMVNTYIGLGYVKGTAEELVKQFMHGIYS